MFFVILNSVEKRQCLLKSFWPYFLYYWSALDEYSLFLWFLQHFFWNKMLARSSNILLLLLLHHITEKNWVLSLLLDRWPDAVLEDLLELLRFSKKFRGAWLKYCSIASSSNDPGVSASVISKCSTCLLFILSIRIYSFLSRLKLYS